VITEMRCGTTTTTTFDAMIANPVRWKRLHVTHQTGLARMAVPHTISTGTADPVDDSETWSTEGRNRLNHCTARTCASESSGSRVEPSSAGIPIPTRGPAWRSRHRPPWSAC
jgi:hypothetical protein